MPTTSKHTVSLPWYLAKGVPLVIVFVVTVLLYANTFGHDFTQDDAIVIYDNDFTKEGVGGIGKIFSKDTFAGFFKEKATAGLVEGGRYRPLTLAVFAVIWEVAGESPWPYHVFVVIVYALLGLVLYQVVKVIGEEFLKKGTNRIFALIASLLFIVHPIHTEAVANVKGLDEIFTLLWSLLSLLFFFQFVRQGKWWHFATGALSFLLAIFSKENAAPFVILTPLTCYLFLEKPKLKRIAMTFGSLLIVFLFYFVVRSQVIGWTFGEAPMEMMNNPFVKLEGDVYVRFSTGEWLASIIYAMGKYVQLLFFPHPLTHDYYPRVWGVVTIVDPAVIMSIIMHVSLISIMIIGSKKKSFISYCIFWFYTTIALMSNVIFPIGTHMSERFLFVPSVAYGLMGAYAFYKINQTKYSVHRWWILGLLIGLYSLKTITRNQVWKDDFTLFTTDVHVSKNSAKVNNAAGGALVDAAFAQEDEAERKAMASQALVFLNKAIEVHPNYKNAYLLRGNAHSYLQEYGRSIQSYDQALQIDPSYGEAQRNLLVVLRAGARYAGQTERDFTKAIQYLNRAIAMAPSDYETNSLMGVAQGSAGNHREAIKYFEKAISIDPDKARTYVNLGYAQMNLGLEDDAQINFQKAAEIDPKALDAIK